MQWGRIFDTDGNRMTPTYVVKKGVRYRYYISTPLVQGQQVTLAFLATPLIETAVEGRLPRGIGVASLRDLPLEWSRQYPRLGLSL